MRGACALCAAVGLCLTILSARAQERLPVPLEPPALSAGALALIEEAEGLDPTEGSKTAETGATAEGAETSAGVDLADQPPPPAFALRSFMALPVAIDVPAASPVYPELAGSFDAADFNQNAANTNAFQIPPDPAGAAGPNHVVSVVNSSIQWFTKDGIRQGDLSLRQFFAAFAPPTLTFDPRVIYDPHGRRFIVITLERIGTVNNQASNQSRIYVAVSRDSDPNSGWHQLAINTKMIIGTSDRGVDFPGLGVDEEAIYITGNMFSFAPAPGFGGVRLWIIPKAPFYNGGAVTIGVHDPVAAANVSFDRGIGQGAVAVTSQPAIVYGESPAELGTFLTQYDALSNGITMFLGVIRISNPLAAAPTFVGHFVPIGPRAQLETLVALPPAPQLGTTRTIATNDRRVSQSPVWRDNNLYVAAPMLPPSGPDAGQVTVRWFRVDTSTLEAPVLAETGTVGGEEIAPQTHTFFPTVTVDRKGNMAVGFAASGPGIYPGAYFSMRLVDDAPGTMRPAGVLRAGVDFYVRAFSTNLTVASRWGDYTGIALDPADEVTFWVFNEYASTRGTIVRNPPGLEHEDGRWGTAFGRFAFACTLECPENITVPNAPGQAGAVVTFAKPSCTGSCGNETVDIPSGSFFPVGTTVVTFRATRQDGSIDTCSFTVTVVDVEPPVISNMSVTPTTLWSPNHKMVDVTVDYTVTDNVGATCTLEVSSNEPVDGTGDGDTAPDWLVRDDTRVQLRAERAGGGAGRIYSVAIRCHDGTFTTTDTVRVSVPKSQP